MLRLTSMTAPRAQTHEDGDQTRRRLLKAATDNDMVQDQVLNGWARYPSSHWPLRGHVGT